MPVYNTVASDSEDSFTASKSKTKPAKDDPESEDEEGEEDGSEYEIEEVLDARRGIFDDGHVGYYVKWKGYGPEENSWVNEADAGNAAALIDEYWNKNPNKKRLTGRKSLDSKKASPQKGRKSSAQVEESEVENASTSNSKKRTRKSVSQKPASEDNDMQVDEPEKPAKKPRKSTTSQAPKASAKKAARSETPEVQEKIIGNMDAYKHMKNWEGLVKSVDTVEQSDGELMVFFTLNTGESVMETNTICKARFPQVLLNFYESNLRWRTAEDNDSTS